MKRKLSQIRPSLFKIIVYPFQGYTIALCGPLELPPSRAALVNSFYQGGFLSGRLVSIVIAAAVRPAKMITASVVGCFFAASLLLGTAERNEYAFYAGAGKDCEE